MIYLSELGTGATSEAGNIFSELLMWGGGVRSILLLMPRDNICMYMVHVCFYICCSDCVGVCMWECLLCSGCS